MFVMFNMIEWSNSLTWFNISGDVYSSPDSAWMVDQTMGTPLSGNNYIKQSIVPIIRIT